MKPLIIFEGPDGAGKSYITKAIDKNYPGHYHVFHNAFIPTTLGQVHALIESCADAMMAHPDRTVLADRHTLISELIYGKIIRGKSLIQEEMSLAYFIRHKVKIMYIRPPDMVLLTRKMEMEERDQNKGHKPKQHIIKVLDKYQEIVNEYDALMERLMHEIPVTWVDTSRKREYESFLRTFNPRYHMQ